MLKIAAISSILMAALMTVAGLAEAGRTVVAVQNVSASPYDEAFKGFKDALSDLDVRIQRMTLSDAKGAQGIDRIGKIKPDLVLAIGIGALSEAVQLGDTPIVYVMVLNPPDTLSRNRQVTGVQMRVAPDKQLAIVRQALPRVKTIGLLYDPRRSAPVVERIISAAGERQIAVIAKKVTHTDQVFNAVVEMGKRIDLFWMLPDLTVVTPETVEFFLLFAMDSGTPLLTFSEKYAELGAVLAIASDPEDMGRQAGEVALQILAGADAGNIPVAEADKAVVTINLKTARKMGAAVNKNALGTARILD